MDDRYLTHLPSHGGHKNNRSVWWFHGHATIPGTDELDPPGPQPVVIRQLQVRRDSAEESRSYDCLSWLTIEHTPPSHDTPEGWKEVLLRTCSRPEKLNRETHEIFIICAVGLKYMIFSWNARNAGNPTQELRIDIAGEDNHFPSQLKPAPETSPHLPNLKASGHPDQYRIGLSRVWSIDPRQIDDQGRPMEPLTALERFTTHTRTARLENPYIESD